MDGRYKADTFEGTIVHFHMNGKPYIRAVQNGLKRGEWLYLNENGVRDSSETYRYGALKLQ
ncbi:MAG: hypothetical protein IPP34_18555 [Bacteroidetes bacterium]|nr:hypothetical protein [Bacteroidota bacterium]